MVDLECGPAQPGCFLVLVEKAEPTVIILLILPQKVMIISKL